MEFFRYKNKFLPQKGGLLLSEPYLADPNFERTTILLTEHNDEGSVGFILNKPSDSRVSEVLDDLKEYDARIFIGGPVQQDTLHFIHRVPSLDDSIEIVPGLFWGGNFDQLITKIETRQIGSTDIKFFLGYSGWSAGQLDEELKIDSWIVSDQVSEELVFETEPDNMWKKAMRGLGGRFSVYSNYPADPRMN
ncbi:MAG TPA: YqgE/AlgH family protein [Cyclobacteriaceae bacterium]|nr:YqgE/AlgH family protein [Cyclobacteriaceae bacterium]HPW63586.1 YqgE/AlgH family protein [Cyclobacteriaceae bacterium]HRG80738.1 YqgE/AlgH family protein [Cyclobacteriaceae bacterium]